MMFPGDYDHKTNIPLPAGKYKCPHCRRDFNKASKGRCPYCKRPLKTPPTSGKG